MSTANLETLPPHVQLVQMSMGMWVSRILHVAAELGLADHLAAGPRSAGELAGPTGTHAPSLHRLMRTLGSLGVLTQAEGGRFGLTPLGEALRSGAPGSARSTILTVASEPFSRAMGELRYSVETGRTGFDKAFGEGFFDFLAKDPDAASQFSETMIGIHGMEPAAVAAAYDFSGLGTVVDVGGASGHMLATILERFPSPRGVLYDLPHVVTDAPALLAARGVADRVTIEGGSFFERVPAGGDAYLLSHIIHDWDEEKCLTILGHVKRAMKPGGRLLLVEMVLPEGDTPHPGKMFDMVMLVIPGGQERTAAEYGTLLGKAGFRLERVVPTESAVSVVEAVVG